MTSETLETTTVKVYAAAYFRTTEMDKVMNGGNV
jgi:hypothetical protein